MSDDTNLFNVLLFSELITPEEIFTCC